MITPLAAQLSGPVQVIRGEVVDGSSKLPLPGASIALYQDSMLVEGVASNANGKYRITEVPVGRYTLEASFVGYQTVEIQDILVTSAKQVILDVQLVPASAMMKEVVVDGQLAQGAALNKMAATSARIFSVDETNRYAGSRGDPARMASNFAGVVGNNDASNDIIVRGNSPMGLLWRIEDVNLPNPNHFAVAGNSGGPVAILNNKLLANSDFLTGAFPAEYGNTISGVFDLNMRRGNNEQHEFTGQLGFLGTELMAEGPLNSRKKASYLAAYRYSTLAIFNNFGINIGTDAVPQYQDLSFKMHLPAGPKTTFSLFGIGGLSKIDIIKSDETDPSEAELFGNAGSDEYFRSRMGIVGAKMTHSLGKNAYAIVALSSAGEVSANNIFLIDRHIENGQFVVDSLIPSQGYRFAQLKQGITARIHQQLGLRHTLEYGLYGDFYLFDFKDSILNQSTNTFTTRLNYEGTGGLWQPFVQWRYRWTPKFTLLAGLHGQWLDFNNTLAVEPRLGLNYQAGERATLSLGLGRHSQMLPTYIYFAGATLPGGGINTYNRDLGFLRSDHVVLGYEQRIGTALRVKTEAYYQRLFDVPVTTTPSSYSVLNEGAELNRFFPDTLVNRGIGYNTGIEMTVEKFFTNNWVFLLTGSLFDSKYRGSDGEWYNTVFNAGFAANVLATKEFLLGKNDQQRLSIGGKVTWTGGRRYTPIDEAASAQVGYAVLIDSLRNRLQYKDYFRFDVRLAYTINARKVSHEIGLDLVNVMNIKNIFVIRYVGGEDPLREEYQLGFLPIFYYRIDI